MRYVILMAVAIFGNLSSSLTAQDNAAEAVLKLVGRDGETISMTTMEFKALPRIEVEAKDRDGTMVKFSGVEMSALLTKVGAAQEEKLRGEWLRAFVSVDATDGYRVVFSLAEFDAAFNDRKIILADTRSGIDLDPKHGPFQLIIPGEKRHSRWVRMVKEIRIVDSKQLEKRAS